MHIIDRYLQDHQKQTHLWLLTIVVVVYIIRAIGGLPFLSLEVNNAFTLGVLTYILYNVGVNTFQQPHIKFYEDDLAFLPDLTKYIRENKAKRAYLIQYSGRRAADIIRTFLRKGTKVTLWVKSPGTAISKEQEGRVQGFINEMPGEFPLPSESESDTATLTVYSYDPPGSLRGILIDDDLLVIGWYTYEHVLVTNSAYPSDKFEISGHDRACVWINKSAPEFKIMRNMFLRQIAAYDNHRINTKQKPHLELSMPKTK